MSTLALSDGTRHILLPDVLGGALKPNARRRYLLEVQALLHRLDHHFTSTRRLAQACDQLEITLRPWYFGQKAANEQAVEKIRHLVDFLPRLDAITGDPKESGLWLISPHYGFPRGEGRSGRNRWGLDYPYRVLLREGRDEEVLAAAIDDFSCDARTHRHAVERLGHVLLDKRQILLKDGHDPLRVEAACTDKSPYFHHRPKAGKTLAEKR